MIDLSILLSLIVMHMASQLLDIHCAVQLQARLALL